jgi:predicted nucleic acid-binding protein
MILLDANPLIALVDNREALNPTAAADLKRLGRRELFLPSPVLTEVCFTLPHPYQRARLRDLIEAFDIQPCPVPREEILWAEVFQWLINYSEHEPDWTDGYLAVLCGREKEFKLWTYDSEFRVVWRRPDGSRIPMAVPERRSR